MPDFRKRCDKGHLVCDNCFDCKCSERDWHAQGECGSLRVSTDRKGRTLCPGCREDFDTEWNG